MNAVLAHQLDRMADAFAKRESAWIPHDRRGRWVVLEPGAGRHLKDSPRAMRRHVNDLTPRRGRRFSSLSRARAFARSVGGTVHRWKRTAPSGNLWRRESPWERALAWPSMLPLPLFQFTEAP